VDEPRETVAIRRRWSLDLIGDARLLILADDFTGACDAAGAFGSSRSTLVICGSPSVWPSGVEVLAVDLDLRERPSVEAQCVIERAARQLGGASQVFVKIDSTLRGPIAALVTGALHGSGKSAAIVAPAFPEQGRFMRRGTLITDTGEGPVLADVLGTLPETVIVDVETPEDLRRVADAAQGHPEWLLVGSAGLARQLAAPVLPARVSRSVGTLLVVAGSPAAPTRAQLRRLEAGEDVVVLSTAPTAERDLGEAAASLAADVATWAERNRPRAVVLTGGATARAVCGRLGVQALRISGELAPGIPVGTLKGGAWDGVTVVTKAGGFGGPDTLVDVVRALS
jgi:uncharacterized protein YgbK (DUF1537 family)